MTESNRVLADDAINDDARLVTRLRPRPSRGGRDATRHPYETRVEGGAFDGDYWRNASETEALAWHASMLSEYRRRVA
jgi:hypothetical protein